MSDDFITIAVIFLIGICLMIVVSVVLALIESLIGYWGNKAAKKELSDAGFETDGFVYTDEDGDRWLVGHKKE